MIYIFEIEGEVTNWARNLLHKGDDGSSEEANECPYARPSRTWDPVHGLRLREPKKVMTSREIELTSGLKAIVGIFSIWHVLIDWHRQLTALSSPLESTMSLVFKYFEEIYHATFIKKNKKIFVCKFLNKCFKIYEEQPHNILEYFFRILQIEIFSSDLYFLSIISSVT